MSTKAAQPSNAIVLELLEESRPLEGADVEVCKFQIELRFCLYSTAVDLQN